MKSTGILMPVASLPSPYGVGDFGKESYRFIDLIHRAGWNLWQILPLNPLGYGNSPYQPYSSMAGDEIYISLSKLCEEGLLEHVPTFMEKATLIDYEKVRAFKNKYLKLAYQRFTIAKKTDDYEQFVQQKWVYQYAVYLSLKKQNHMVCWNEWPKEQQMWIVDGKYDLKHLKEAIDFEMFVQYEFYRQWMQLKKYANHKGIQVMGDLPFYVGLDSLDVWANQECFLLDADSKPVFVAGVPPDYFSKTGQRWGNPIYDWKHIKNNQFEFWISRLRYNAKQFDIVRIDHFRAFDTYWKIPSSCETAIEGEWCEAPGYAMFDEVFRLMPNIQIVVEDLGELRPEVLELRDHFGFKGMNIVQFSFNPRDLKSAYEKTDQSILYTGTHDNQPVRGWYESQPSNMKKFIRKSLRQFGCIDKPATRGLVQFAFSRNSYMTIIPMQDILELGDEARINRPGILGSPNWEWRLTSLSPLEKAIRERSKYYRD